MVFAFLHGGLATSLAEQSMTASWYGRDWHGKKTATGEIYDMHSMTAAHKTLPFGTILHVRNPKNEKSVRVMINNRGPYIRGRDLDLSYAAAKKLDMLNSGVAKLLVSHAGFDDRYTKGKRSSGGLSGSLSPSLKQKKKTGSR